MRSEWRTSGKKAALSKRDAQVRDTSRGTPGKKQKKKQQQQQQGIALNGLSMHSNNGARTSLRGSVRNFENAEARENKRQNRGRAARLTSAKRLRDAGRR